MNNDFDERMRFYAQHHSLINEWSRLPDEWRERTNAFLKSQAERLCGSRPDNSLLIDYPNERHPKIFLYKPEWEPDHKESVQSGHRYPFVAIGMEWLEPELDILSTELPRRSKPTTPYCGIFVMNKPQANDPRQPAIFREILKAVIARHETLLHEYNNAFDSPWWPVHKFITFDKSPLHSNGSQGPDLQAFCAGVETMIGKSIYNAWNDLHAIVDTALVDMDSKSP